VTAKNGKTQLPGEPFFVFLSVALRCVKSGIVFCWLQAGYLAMTVGQAFGRTQVERLKITQPALA
jgi:hypothetical protein